MADKHNYYLLELTTDGPQRLQGNAGYPTLASARAGAERFLRANPFRRITLFQTHETMWIDPNPSILDDLPKPEEPR